MFISFILVFKDRLILVGSLVYSIFCFYAWKEIYYHALKISLVLLSLEKRQLALWFGPMSGKYDFKEVEARLAESWERNGVYRFERNGNAKVYAIDTPPPTISGLIHVGHAYSYSQADFVARYKRMRGYNVFYPFGFDNNGIPTEILVERNYKTTAEDMGREKFSRLVEEETKKYEEMYRRTWTQIGISVDWSLRYSTISKEVQRISQLSFLMLANERRAYRKESPSIWCPKCKTAISQMELKDMDFKSRFITIQFSDGIQIATTRPELLPACVAVMVNDKDEKNAEKIGMDVTVPLFGNKVKVIGDRRVDPEKGTGVVMCCTFGDLTDIEWYKAYNLELRIAIDEDGRMLLGKYKGMKIREAREEIIKELKEKGLVLDEKEIVHTVNVHERCNTEIEFLVKKQWYIRYLDIKEKLIGLGEELDWHPEYMKVRYKNWVSGLQWDWSISRQRYYGVPFPVWYCRKCGEPVFADIGALPVNPLEQQPEKRCVCGSESFEPETDIMDTWATSSITPMINGRWKTDSGLFERIFPMDLRPQAHDIISFWLFTTIVKSYLHTGKLPWKSALISGHGLDSKGAPMHKSVGNIVEPKVVIERYGADALRWWASSSAPGSDASFQEKELVAGSKLINKLWNVNNFITMNYPEASDAKEGAGKNIVDRWILSICSTTIEKVTSLFEQYDYYTARREVERFFWIFCDDYLEFVKYRVYGGDASVRQHLDGVFLAILKMLAPFMPYITDEIYAKRYSKVDGSTSIHVSKWPVSGEFAYNKESLEHGWRVAKVLESVRILKHNIKMALNAPVKELVISERIGEGEDDIKGAMNISSISIGEGSAKVDDLGISIELRT